MERNLKELLLFTVSNALNEVRLLTYHSKRGLYKFTVFL